MILYPKEVTFPELFEWQVKCTPEKIALVVGDEQFTYKALSQRSSQLAHYLRRQGVGPDILVGVCLERSVDLIVSLLAILKAGGAYVPLDPNYPSERLEYMLHDAQVSLLITSRERHLQLPGYCDDILHLNWETLSFESSTVLSVSTSPGNLAYVLYTSGSTGHPKGVMISHQNMATFLHWVKSVFSYKELSGVLAATSICFDLSVFELFGPLSQGGTVILTENFLQVAKLLAIERVTLINTVPSAIEALLDKVRPPAVRTVNLAGELLKTELVASIYRRWNVERVYDLYGPSETTTYATFGWRSETGPATIGKELGTTSVYGLAHDGQLVPAGLEGELYIGGPQVARGYLQGAALTAERFVPDPFSTMNGSRLYRTGDRMRHHEDGNIEFLGRLDHQVKLRGFRIELGEIETIIAQQAGIRESLVIVREEEENMQQLVGYVIPKADYAVDVSSLRIVLRTKLPEYMVPTRFVILETLPRTPNGKIDRKALPAPEMMRSEFESTYISPSTPQEELLAEIWQKVLSIDQIGVDDNFFELGGHSLLAIRIIAQIQITFSIDLALQTFFNAPTIAQLVHHLPKVPEPSLLTHHRFVNPSPRPTPIPLSYTQERFWFLDQYLTDREVNIVPRAFQLKGPLNLRAFKESLFEIVNRHEILRTTFPLVEGQPQVMVASSIALDIPVISLEGNPEEEYEAEVQRWMKDLLRPFDFSQGPLIRFALMRFQEEDHLFLHTMHHIITDAWSMEIFHHELATLYEAFESGHPSPLPPLSLQYADYAIWQRQLIDGPTGDQDLIYWKNQLAHAPHSCSFPADFPRKAHQTFRGARRSRHLSKEFTHSLRTFLIQRSTSLFMVLLTGLHLLLHRHTGMSDVVVGAFQAGRTRVEHEQLLGCLLNTLALRGHISQNITFSQFLSQVRQTVLEAVKYQNLPFEKIVTELHPTREIDRSPFFQVLLNMNNASDKELDLKGLTTIEQSFLNPKVLFDLTMYYQEFSDHIQLTFSYNADLYTSITVERLLEHYEILLQGIVNQPDTLVSALKLSSSPGQGLLQLPPEHHCHSYSAPDISHTAVDYSVVAQFEAQVQRNPLGLAVKTPTQAWTYEGLNQRANQLAHSIKQRWGTTPGRIGLACAEEAPLLAALMGILKTGKTYVPLDPHIPSHRLELIRHDAQLDGIVCDHSTVTLAMALTPHPEQVINCEALAASVSTENLQHVVTPETLAYLIYTSGSTGQPKGVMQTHRNVLQHCRTYSKSLHLNASDRLTLFSSYAFDAAVMDIFGALLNGAGLVLWDFRSKSAVVDVVAQLATESITIYHSTPTVFRHLLQNGTGGADLSAIRAVVLGGEEAQQYDLQLFAHHIPPPALFVNGLGPTESTMALQYICTHETLPKSPRVPVGYPVRDTEILILNTQGEPGQIYGEIGIESPYVAVGYWQQPALTQQVFRSGLNNLQARLYRTGDIGRLRSDGSIEFMGRLDEQIKLRGYRIELGEIESSLQGHHLVHQAVVLCRDDMLGEKQLVAYVVPTSRETLEVSGVRAYLKTQLPDYMIPTSFVVLEALPLTPNGKINRHTLPVPDSSHRVTANTFVAPQTLTEELVAGIWQDLLHVERVGRHDDFFELGGHSLLAMGLSARLRAQHQIDLPLRAVFDHPALVDQAIAIERILLEEINTQLP